MPIARKPAIDDVITTRSTTIEITRAAEGNHCFAGKVARGNGISSGVEASILGSLKVVIKN